jgi:hypothetical protein
MAFGEITFAEWEKTALESAGPGGGITRMLVSGSVLGCRRDLAFCADTKMHNTLNMNAINSLQKYEKSSVYIFLINEQFL